jgi:hypothetical protein
MHPVECVAALLKDIAAFYPDDQLELERDNKRIAQQFSSRGLSFFTLNLPELGKRFNLSLDSGRLDLGTLPHTRSGRRGSKIPRLFQGLWRRVFDEDGCLRVDPDTQAIFFLRTLFEMFKKVEMDCSPRALFSATEEFFKNEESLPPTPDLWYGDEEPTRHDFGHLSDLSVCPAHVFHLSGRMARDGEVDLLNSVQSFCDRVSAELGFFDSQVMLGRHGPGAVSKLPGSKYIRVSCLA